MNFIEKSELEELQKLASTFDQLAYDSGNLTFQITDLEDQLEDLKLKQKDIIETYYSLSKIQKELSEKLKEKYGSVTTIDIETGKIT